MSQLSPKARALLERTSPHYEPSAADRARLRRGMNARLGVALGAGAATVATSVAAPAAVASSKTAVGLSLGTKLLMTVAIAGSLATATVVLKPERPPAAAPTTIVATAPARNALPAPPPVAAAPTTIEPPTPPPLEAPPVQPAATQRAAIAAATEPASAPAAANPLEAEMALLRDAQSALRDHDGARALVALDSHAQRFPHGALAEERDAARVIALCSVGRKAEGALAKATFLRDHPDAPATERVRKSCTD